MEVLTSNNKQATQRQSVCYRPCVCKPEGTSKNRVQNNTTLGNVQNPQLGGPSPTSLHRARTVDGSATARAPCVRAHPSECAPHRHAPTARPGTRRPRRARFWCCSRGYKRVNRSKHRVSSNESIMKNRQCASPNKTAESDRTGKPHRLLCLNLTNNALFSPKQAMRLLQAFGHRLGLLALAQ